ncbi:RNA polymerase sigma factor [Mediterraneibacter glycyrrhizinilyticus]|nr:RNA polymerase sigma factor [Mediterraneibacter glycyrrhizinilyticus]
MLMNLEEYYDDIYRYCFFRMQDHSLAEDLTQEAFLYTIARNLCIDHIRHTKTRPESVINCDISIFSDAAHSTEGTAFSPTASVSELTDTSIVLVQALQTLSESDREIICLRYVLELNPGEIGRIMNLSRFAVYRRLKRALKLLKNQLRKEDFQ